MTYEKGRQKDELSGTLIFMSNLDLFILTLSEGSFRKLLHLLNPQFLSYKMGLMMLTL